jgi:hypothetical protein
MNHIINYVVLAALVDVTPRASLVGKEPKLMACMRDTSRSGCSPRMIHDLFYLHIWSMMCMWLYVCESIIV